MQMAGKGSRLHIDGGGAVVLMINDRRVIVPWS